MIKEDVVMVLSEAGVHETWHNVIIDRLGKFIRPSRRPDIVVCHACNNDGGKDICNQCNYGTEFEQ